MEETIPFKNLHSREYQGHKKKVHSGGLELYGHEASLRWKMYAASRTQWGEYQYYLQTRWTHIAVGNRDDELTILDVRKFKPIHRRKFSYEVGMGMREAGKTYLSKKERILEVNEIAWNMTGEMFFFDDWNGTVEVLAYPALRPLDTLMAHTAGCYCIAIDPIGSQPLDISEMLCVRTFTKLEWPVRTISFNHTGEYIASASEDLFIDISNVHTGRTVHQIPCRAAMNSVEWNPKHNLLAYAGDDKNKYQADEGVFRIFGFESA
ncbi:THO complex subunit 3 [Vitis vinifera]|uniref:THO complex subunit 3 n=1 Tax=Vitis vinifera TaxID=29760 RepID=A0A438EQT9_VITVI|nr:THO complex subunit 3 [Vitis vinifera]